MNETPTKDNNIAAETLIGKKVATAMLLDAYGVLLTERQQQCLSLFYEEDLSLSEIGAAFAISRQAVHDAIRHGEALLREYERQLHLVEKENHRQEVVKKLRAVIGDQPEAAALLEQLL